MWWLSKKNQSSVVVIASVVGLLLIAVLGLKIYWSVFKEAEEENKIDPTTYQAIFLADEQIYFGKLKDIDSLYPVLEDVYYIKLESEDPNSGRLVKLGQEEPHSPQDQMIINRDYILFWENLKPDSRVIQTIRNLKLNQ